MATKSAAKNQTVAFVTPWFAARYPKISAPDTKGKFADGKFKTDGIFLSEDDYQKALAATKAAAKTLLPDVPFEDVVLPLKEFFDGKDDQRASAGMGIVLKSKYRPAVFDAKKKKLPEGAKIGGGSVIRVASAFFGWSKTTQQLVVDAQGKKTKQSVTEHGVSLRLGDVQVKELKEGASQGDGSSFDEVEGFEYDGAEGAAGGDQFTDDPTSL